MDDNEYIGSINRAIDYIHENIDKSLTVEEISDYCCFSKYYFNRVFKSVVNESIYSFIKRLKLEAAAFKLRTNEQRSITDIALEAGYSSSNFATAFKDYFGISASDYRRSREVPMKDSYLSVLEHIKSVKKQQDFFERLDSKIKIKQLPSMTLEYERFIGNYFDLSESWHRFCIEASSRHILNESNKFIGISYDDPLITDENRCMYDMCVKVDKVKSINVHRIEQGLYACYDFYDRLENLAKAFNEILALWMPFSKYTIDNWLPLEIYHSSMDNEGRMKIELCISIKEL